MYTVQKTIEVAGAHKLNLNYQSKCSVLHGHNWKIVVTCKSDTLDENGMVTDFTHIKKVVDILDHAYINDFFPDKNPTAENIAKFICEHVEHCVKVSVQESGGNVATYEI